MRASLSFAGLLAAVALPLSAGAQSASLHVTTTVQSHCDVQIAPSIVSAQGQLGVAQIAVRGVQQVGWSCSSGTILNWSVLPGIDGASPFFGYTSAGGCQGNILGGTLATIGSSDSPVYLCATSQSSSEAVTIELDAL
jgi:hypothetical protein